MGGERVVKLLKGTNDICNIPVILFSENTEIEEIYKRSKANGFLAKPFDVSDLLSIVKKYVSKVGYEI